MAAARQLLVLYGSQTGTAEDVAARVGREGKRRHFRARVVAMDSYDMVSRLHSRVKLCSPATQGTPFHSAQIAVPVPAHPRTSGGVCVCHDRPRGRARQHEAVLALPPPQGASCRLPQGGAICRPRAGRLRLPEVSSQSSSDLSISVPNAISDAGTTLWGRSCTAGCSSWVGLPSYPWHWGTTSTTWGGCGLGNGCGLYPCSWGSVEPVI